MAKKKEPDKLAQDAAAALAAGMSYGKRKAIHGDTKPEPEVQELVPQGWLICQYCGKPFKPRSYRPQKFCEPYCQNEAYKEKVRERKRAYMAMKRASEKL